MDVLEYASRHNGIVTTAEVEAAGFARSRLSEAVRCGTLVRVARGVYCQAEAWEDEYLVACLRFPKGVLSHGTALFLHDLTDRTPECVTMTFPRSHNASSARGAGVLVRTCERGLTELGLSEVRTPSGNVVRCYDVERSLCDMLRGTSVVDVQVLNPAMRSYLASGARDVPKLLGYARELGVDRKVRTYVEVLL